MLELFTWSTPNGRKVSILLEELGAAYTVRPIDLGKREQLLPAFVARNLNHRIPVLVDTEGPGDAPITLAESGAILVYLAEKFSSPLWPAEPATRYMTLQWLMFQMGGVGPMFGQLHHFRRLAPSEKYGLDRYQAETRRLYGVLEARLGEASYLNGTEYSLADIATYPWVARFDLHDLDWSAHPNLRRWYDAIDARPAVQRGMAVP